MAAGKGGRGMGIRRQSQEVSLGKRRSQAMPLQQSA